MKKRAIKFRSENRLNGRHEHYICRDTKYVLFPTREAARCWIELEYGYIKHRKDLKQEPHGWKNLIPVRVEVTLKEITSKG